MLHAGADITPCADYTGLTPERGLETAVTSVASGDWEVTRVWLSVKHVQKPSSREHLWTQFAFPAWTQITEIRCRFKNLEQ